MFTRSKLVWAAFALCVAVAGVGGWLLRVVPARPGAAVRTAQDFVECLRAHDLERAYRLTTRRGEVGGSFEEFRGVVRQQWPAAAPVPVRFVAVGPFQSYGNRLRRWFHGREADPKEVWLEFSVGGVPFGVRAARTDGGEWKVSYFQSHAG